MLDMFPVSRGHTHRVKLWMNWIRTYRRLSLCCWKMANS